MSKRGGYIVLERNHSNSSSAVHEVRRGGDGVLYCTCPGWRNCKPIYASAPKVCKHTKRYVATNPGTVYGPPGRFAGEVPAGLAASIAADNAAYRARLKAERDEVKKRGVPTPPEALSAYALDLDLD